MMNLIGLAYSNLDTTRKKLILGFTISLLFHLLLLYLLMVEDVYRIDLKQPLISTPEEVTILFPENKPKQIVENINPNEEVPENSDLLSEYNSRGKNENLLEQRRNQPFSTGNTPFANLSQPASSAQNSYVKKSNQGSTEKFNRGALLADNGYPAQDNPQTEKFSSENQKTYTRENQGTNNMLDQQEFSADDLGGLTLSTYAWEWASYINYFRRRLYEVWRTPPAYFSMGMIHGQTVIRLVIDRNGRMVESKVLEHQGHSSLQVSSENAIHGVFPLKPLPVDFPDETLTLTLTLVYPDLKKRRN
jgi:outer membrane biosynthesis protein TonB